jgi:hypothetical protein
MATTKYARVLDDRLEASASNDVCFVLKEGAQTVSYVNLIASSSSTSSTNFNLNNIANSTCRDPRLCLDMEVTVTFNVNNATAGILNLIGSDNFGFKQYPLNRCVQSIQHQINSASYTLPTNSIIDSIARLNSFPEDVDFYENTQPDIIDTYANASGSNITPLAPYSSNILGDGINKPRSLNYSITGNAVAANSVNQIVTVVCNLYEPLITPFTNVSSKNRQGLYAINGELITIAWVTDLFNNMFAFFNQTALVINSSVVTFTQTPSLRCIYLIPKEPTLAQIPRESVYSYNDYQVFTQTIVNGNFAAAAQTGTITSPVCNFSSMPAKILVYVRTADGSRNAATPDKYLLIKSISAVFDNGAPCLNNVDDAGNQLYDISVANGLRMPRVAFQQGVVKANGIGGLPPLYGCGSMLVLDPCYNLAVRETDTVGTSGRYVLQFSANFQNNTGTAMVNPTWYIVGISNGMLERSGNEYRNFLLYTPADMINHCRALAPINQQEFESAKVGNGFLSGGSVSEMVRKAFKHLKNLPKYAEVGKELAKRGKDALAMVRSVSGHGIRRLGIHPAKADMFYD